jgi:hypothetical protein
MKQKDISLSLSLSLSLFIYMLDASIISLSSAYFLLGHGPTIPQLNEWSDTKY